MTVGLVTVSKTCTIHFVGQALFDSDSTIQLGIPCHACDYSLRGLQPDGRCPECGSSIAESIEIWKYRIAPVRPLHESSSAWLRQVAEGASLGLLAFAAMVLIAFAPDEALKIKSDARRMVLVAVRATWIIAGWSILKLTTAEVGPAAERRFSVRRVLRWSSMVYVLVPCFLSRTTHTSPFRFVIFGMAIAWLFSALVSATTYYWYLSRILERAQMRWTLMTARALSVPCVLFMVTILLPSRRYDESSLAAMMEIPTIQAGALLWHQDYLREWAQLASHPSFAVAVFLSIASLIFLAQACVHVALTLALWRAYQHSKRAEAERLRRT